MKRLAALVLIVVEAILIAPFFLQGHIISTIESGSDIRAHVGVINGTGDSLYAGQRVLAFMFSPIAGASYLHSVYLWFSFAVLMAVPLVLFYVVKRTEGLTSALVVVPLALFVSPGILALFSYGVIFNIINVYIILPVAILFAVLWWKDRKALCLLISACLFALFGVFHTTGLYLVGAGMVALLYLSWQRRSILMGILSVAAILGLAIMAFNSYSISGDATLPDMGLLSYWGYALWALVSHLSFLLIPLVFVILVHPSLSLTAKAFLLIIGTFVAALTAVLFTGMTRDSLFINRIASDTATLTAIGVAAMIGLWLEHLKSKITNAVVAGAIAIGSIPALTFWLAR